MLIKVVNPNLAAISDEQLNATLQSFLSTLCPQTDDWTASKKVLLLPPDFTRYHSQAGKISSMLYTHSVAGNSPLNNDSDGFKITDIMPALGTHQPMNEKQYLEMFGQEINDANLHRIHDWRNDVITIGHAPAEMVNEATRGLVQKPWPAQLNKIVVNGNHDLIFSIGQVVPHEVMGMANYNKNLFVGVGGVEAINLSHFIGAVYGMEKMMGKADNPLRAILNYSSKQFLEGSLPLYYIQTVMGTNLQTNKLEMKGLFIGDNIECYNEACALSLKVNFTMVEKPLTKVIVQLDADEFHSTWLGNKAIYRTRMALATGGHLIILAPSVCKFGEDGECDRLIRKYGYVNTPKIMKYMSENEELQSNLSVVAHLIHGSSEERFNVTYCTPLISCGEILNVGYNYDDIDIVKEKYQVDQLQDGMNIINGEEVFYVSNPALGLWAHQSRLEYDDDKKFNGKRVSEVAMDVEQVTNTGETGSSGGVGGWASSSNKKSKH